MHKLILLTCFWLVKCTGKDKSIKNTKIHTYIRPPTPIPTKKPITMIITTKSNI